MALRAARDYNSGMKIRDLMTGDVDALDPDAPLVEAALRMAETGCGLVPIMEKGRIVGIVTDRDIVVRALARGWNIEETTVEEIMTPDVLQCREDEDADEAARLMARHRVRRLVVVGLEGDLAGIVSREDLSAAGVTHEPARRPMSGRARAARS
jgi:CBS domain-containing protein